MPRLNLINILHVIKKETKRLHTNRITLRFLEAVDFLTAGKLSVAELSAKIGISPSNLSRLRKYNTQYAPTLEACTRLCKHYDISAVWLLMGIGEMQEDDQLMATYKTMHKNMAAIEKMAAEVQMKVKSIRRRIS